MASSEGNTSINACCHSVRFLFAGMANDVSSIHIVILGFYKILVWKLLLLIVYVTPCLYWRAGDELSDNYVITPAMNDKYAKPPIDYLKVMEHHGLCKPKICYWPSLTKIYGVANAYAVATESSGREYPIDVTLVFTREAWKTSDILGDAQLFWHAVEGLNPDSYNFRHVGASLNDTLYKSWLYVQRFAYEALPGGVFITNKTYWKVWSFRSEVVEPNDDADGWWTSDDLTTLVTEVGSN